MPYGGYAARSKGSKELRWADVEKRWRAVRSNQEFLNRIQFLLEGKAHIGSLVTSTDVFLKSLDELVKFWYLGYCHGPELDEDGLLLPHQDAKSTLMAPSLLLDFVWHELLLDEAIHGPLMKKLFGDASIFHIPFTRQLGAFKRTLDIYRETFGETPPEEIWGTLQHHVSVVEEAQRVMDAKVKQGTGWWPYFRPASA